MFGYMTIAQNKLTKEQFARFKQGYCGLCRSLGKRYGQLERLTLSNDMTFLALLLSSLYEPREESGALFCPKKTTKGHTEDIRDADGYVLFPPSPKGSAPR